MMWRRVAQFSRRLHSASWKISADRKTEGVLESEVPGDRKWGWWAASAPFPVKRLEISFRYILVLFSASLPFRPPSLPPSSFFPCSPAFVSLFYLPFLSPFFNQHYSSNACSEQCTDQLLEIRMPGWTKQDLLSHPSGNHLSEFTNK